MRTAVVGGAGGAQQLLISAPLSAREAQFLRMPAGSGLPPGRKKLASRCSPGDAASLTALPLRSSTRFKAARGTAIGASTSTEERRRRGTTRQPGGGYASRRVTKVGRDR